MLLSSWQSPPRLSLHPVSPHSNRDTARTLLSSSPLPSPGLPAIIPRHGKKPPRLNRRWGFQLLTWLILCILLFLFASRIVRSDQILAAINPLSPDNQAYQVVADGLPKQPSPILVTDQRGRSKWTISIPPTMRFPLEPAQYASICEQSMEVSRHVAESKKPQGQRSHGHKAHHPYYYRDPHFMDIAEAESHGLFPDQSPQKPLTHSQDLSTTEPSLKRCARTLTYALETSNAGLGHTLLTLWLAYGLAQSEDRAFFVDDTNWPYGSYSTYFKPPPSPGCLPPPKTQVLPCPHQARHLLVSAATTRQTFGHMFVDHFEDGRKMGVMRQHNIFGMMRVGYEALFQGKLNDEDEAYLRRRVAELNDNNSTRAAQQQQEGGEEEIGVHVRHGDRHPLEYQYHKSYIPLEKYLDTARNLSSRGSPSSSSSSLSRPLYSSSSSSSSSRGPTRILIASDDPAVYADPLVTLAPTSASYTIEKAQSHINLASREPLAAGAGVGKPGPGWEGGFFKDVFWALGDHQLNPYPNPNNNNTLSTNPKPSADISSSSSSRPEEDPHPDRDPNTHTHPSPAALELRQLVARAYLLDLAVLGQTDRVVCALSAYGCRILAVMMGWDAAFVGRPGGDGGGGGGGGGEVGEGEGGAAGWVNVDGDFEWRGVDW